MAGCARLRRHFDEESRGGLVASFADLSEFRDAKRLSCPDAELRKMRYHFKHTDLFSSIKRPKHYMTASILKYGTVMVDLAVFHPEWKRSNGGNSAFLVGVECVSGQLSVHPCRDKKSASWEAAVRVMVERDFNSVVCIISDQDASVTSDRFRANIKEKYGVEWSFLKSRGKAMKAERSIR
jgi:hypothetical protein